MQVSEIIPQPMVGSEPAEPVSGEPARLLGEDEVDEMIAEHAKEDADSGVGG